MPALPAQSPAAAVDADHLVALAKATALGDGGLRTARLLNEALALDPQHHEAQILRERLYQTFVPRWHFPMLADTARNKAYASAIAAKVKPGGMQPVRPKRKLPTSSLNSLTTNILS